MAFSKLFKLWSSSKPGHLGAKKPATADSMADAIGLELKGIISQAVLTSLQDRESHYLTSILEKSVFLIDAVVITPQDKEAASSLEKFLRLHSDIDPGFRTQFFHSVLEKEYRSPRGAGAMVAPEMQPSIQFNDSSLETPSSEEAFQISLRGRRLAYTAAVSLKGPVARTSPAALAAAAAGPALGGAAEPVIGEARSAPSGPTGRASAASGLAPQGSSFETIVLKIHDTRGQRVVHAQSPVLLGREAPADYELGALQFVPIAGTYVSRRHLVVVSVAEDTYFFLHDAATLSCRTANGQLLRPGTLYSLARHARAQLVFGLTNESRSLPSDPAHAAQFPIVEISRLEREQAGSNQATPRPSIA